MRNIPIKNTGDTLTADEFNDIPGELENAITDTGQTLSSGDLHQESKAMSIYAAGGDYYTDGGTANTYVLSTIGSKQNPIAYFQGMRIRFVPANSNTGASTVNVASLGAKNIKEHNGNNPIAGDITKGEEIEMSYDGTNFVIQGSSNITSVIDLLPKISGLAPSNDAGDLLHDIKIEPGTFIDSTGTKIFRLNTALIKQIDAVWAQGTNQGGFPSGLGSVAADTWYHYHLIGSDNNTTYPPDGGYDTSTTAANLLGDATNYQYYKRRFSVLTDGSANILPFFYFHTPNDLRDYFYWKDPPEDVNVTNPGTSAALRTLSVPKDYNVIAILNAGAADGGSVHPLLYISNPSVDDEAPSISAAPFGQMHEATDNTSEFGHIMILTDTSSQVRTRLNGSGAGTKIYIATIGWIE